MCSAVYCSVLSYLQCFLVSFSFSEFWGGKERSETGFDNAAAGIKACRDSGNLEKRYFQKRFCHRLSAAIGTKWP